MTESAAPRANADPAELDKFAALASRWWDPQGEMRALHQLNPLRLDWIEQQAGIAGQRCLDCGCGGGLLAEGLAQRGAARVLGIDLTDEALTVARLHAGEAGLDGLDYRLASAAELAAEQEAAWDLVCCMEVLEHVPEPATLVADLARLVRPGGSVLLSTLNRNLKSFALAIVGAEYLLRLLPPGTHEYARFIRPSELDDWAGDAGLVLQALCGIVYDPLRRDFRLDEQDVAVNYLAHFRRPASP
ncbi:MAG: bifunctional 2-polyprenyl-6-hydroxyphenol methylase/3-demethylubiquinol 3-O-methyltransferase UbiG [Gammaproteobacteria bacterium]|nr:MAG: bifunctional 2-polyprenyl-6-hydroxyphenol methylase/3-demethylubiquinol 3-O-methyltransferase UbiG [Gammaproteobacteria bacterium]